MPDKLHEAFEKIGEAKAAIVALHGRQDRMEVDIKERLDQAFAILTTLVAEKNQRIGWMAAMVLVGSIITGIISHFWKG